MSVFIYPPIKTIVNETASTVVDFMDQGSMVPTGANLIPASSALPLKVVDSLAKACTKIQIIHDIGEFMNIYSDAAGLLLIGHVTLTPDEYIDVDLPLGGQVYVRAAKNVAIDDLNSILSMNFIG